MIVHSVSAEFSQVLWPVLYRMAVAFLCGALVGAERERKAKPAGFRTNILICLGAALFTLCSEFAATFVARAPQEATRISAQIVTGVGFIGAGAIMRSGPGVIGLTTAATIWLVAAIGMIVGIGFPVVGIITAAMTVLTLAVLGRIEKRIIGPCDMRTMEIHVGQDRPLNMARLEAVMESASWPSRIDKIQASEQGTQITITYCARHPTHRAILWDLGRILE